MRAMRTTTVSMDGRLDRSHAYRICSARARALVSGRCTRHLGQDVRRAQRRLGRLVPLVPRRAASAGLRLLQAIRGEDTEAQGHAVRQRYVAEASGGLGGEELEVGGLAADPAAGR